MADRLWKVESGLSNIYISLDKKRLSKVELAEITFRLADQFGYIDEVDIPSGLGDGTTYCNIYNDPNWNKGKPAPSAILNFVEKYDVKKMHFHFGALCHDENEQRLISDLVSFSFYLEAGDEDWGLYFNINNDIFAPRGWESNSRAKKLAEENAPILKKFLEQTLSSFPIISYEWEDDYSNIEMYLKKI